MTNDIIPASPRKRKNSITMFKLDLYVVSDNRQLAVYSKACSGQTQRNMKALHYWRGTHWWPVNSLHKGPVMRRTFLCYDVIIFCYLSSDSEKRALAQAKLQKKQEESKSLPAADTENVAPSVITNGSEEKSQEPAVQNTETKKSNVNPPPKSPKQHVRPKSGGSETISNKINKYPGVLSNREQLFNYHRRERDRKKVSRMFIIDSETTTYLTIVQN